MGINVKNNYGGKYTRSPFQKLPVVGARPPAPSTEVNAFNLTITHIYVQCHAST